MSQQFFVPETVIEKVNRLDFTRIPQAWATLISPFCWDHYFSLTFRNFFTRSHDWSTLDTSLVLKTAWREFDWWMRTLNRNRSIDWVAAPEFTTSGHLHFHGLSSGTHNLGVDHLDKTWRRRPYRDHELNTTGNSTRQKKWKTRGHSSVRIYRPNTGAEHYLMKHVTPDWSEVRVQIRGPALRNMVSSKPKMTRRVL